MHPFLFELFGFKVYSYGVVMITAFLICIFFALKYAPRDLLSTQDIYNFCLITIASLLIGTKLFEMLIYWDFSPNAWFNTLKFWQRGSFSFFPALLLAIILIFTYCKLRKIPFLKTIDYLLPFAILGIAIQRTFGCFLGGCCYGKPTQLPIGIIFSNSSHAGIAFPGIPIHPTQLYYGITTVAIFIFLAWYKQKARQDGEMTTLGLMMLTASYFLITFLRGDIQPGQTLLKISLSQYYSLGLFLTMFLIFTIRSFKKKNHNPEVGI